MPQTLSAIFFMAGLVTPGAVAPNRSSPPVIWQNLTAGMTKGEVTRAVSNNVVQLTESCAVKLVFGYKNDGLDSVTMVQSKSFHSKEGHTQAIDCKVGVLQSLIEKYGVPLAHTAAPSKIELMRLYENRYGRATVYNWNTPDVAISYNDMLPYIQQYQVRYSVRHVTPARPRMAIDPNKL